MEKLRPNVFEETIRDKPSQHGCKRRWILCLYFCGMGGVAIGLIGLSLSALKFFGFMDKAPALNRIGTLLIFLAFPVLMFGSHAMDKIAEIDKGEKRTAFEAEEKRKVCSPDQWRRDEITYL